MDVLILLIAQSSGDTIAEITVDQEAPYRFADVVPGGVTGNIVVKILIHTPKDYIPWPKAYVKRECCDLIQDVRLKHPEDVYVESLDRGRDAADNEAAIRYFSEAVEAAVTLGQNLEARRALGAAYLKVEKYVDQQAVLDSVYHLPDISHLTPARKLGYWNARLDGLLYWTQFASSPLPERDFGRRIAAGNDTLLTNSWRKFLEDFKVAYPEARLDLSGSSADEITAQLQAVLRAVGRKPGP